MLLLYYIVLYCTIYGVELTEGYNASWEHYVAIWESNVTNVVSMQRHIKLLIICITGKPVDSGKRKLCLKNCVIGLNLVLLIYDLVCVFFLNIYMRSPEPLVTNIYIEKV